MQPFASCPFHESSLLLLCGCCHSCTANPFSGQLRRIGASFCTRKLSLSGCFSFSHNLCCCCYVYSMVLHVVNLRMTNPLQSLALTSFSSLPNQTSHTLTHPLTTPQPNHHTFFSQTLFTAWSLLCLSILIDITVLGIFAKDIIHERNFDSECGGKENGMIDI